MGEEYTSLDKRPRSDTASESSSNAPSSPSALPPVHRPPAKMQKLGTTKKQTTPPFVSSKKVSTANVPACAPPASVHMRPCGMRCRRCGGAGLLGLRAMKHRVLCGQCGGGGGGGGRLALRRVLKNHACNDAPPPPRAPPPHAVRTSLHLAIH
jgi:hypothetical protein